MATKSRRKVDSSKARRRITSDSKRIVLVKSKWPFDNNPRRPGTNAAKRVGSGIAYLRRHPKATTKELTAKTNYTSTDIGYDVQHGFAKLVSA